MKLEEQVLTIEQAKHLQKLGLDMSDAAFAWFTNRHTKESHLDRYIDRKHSVYTYTLQELWNKLPKCITIQKIDYNLCNTWEGLGYAREFCGYDYDDTPFGGNDYHVCFDSDDELQNAYDLLCWVVANGYLKEIKK